MGTELQKIAIEHYLPHRPPMLMVDAILQISPTQVLCSFVIEEDNLFLLEGHFQEVGLIENMAQTCSSIVGQTFYAVDYNPESDKRIIGFISGIKQLSIYNLPKVGDEILTSSTLTSQFDGEGYSICTMEVTVKREEEILSSAEINLFLKKQ